MYHVKVICIWQIICNCKINLVGVFGLFPFAYCLGILWWLFEGFLLVPVACNQIIKNCHKQINNSESSGKYFTLKAFYAILAIGLIDIIFV